MWKPREQIKGVSKATQLELKAVLLESRARSRTSATANAGSSVGSGVGSSSLGAPNRGVWARAQRDAADANSEADTAHAQLAAKAAQYAAWPRDADGALQLADRGVTFVRERRPRNDAERLELSAQTAAKRQAVAAQRAARRERRQRRRSMALRLLQQRQARVRKYREQRDGAFVPLSLADARAQER